MLDQIWHQDDFGAHGENEKPTNHSVAGGRALSPVVAVPQFAGLTRKFLNHPLLVVVQGG